MKKIVLLAAMLAMVLAVAVPALAQVVVEEIGQESESGGVALGNEVANEGDNSNVCAPALQFGNSGNLQNAQGFAQYDSTTEDIEFEGSVYEFAPELESACDQTVSQAAAAG